MPTQELKLKLTSWWKPELPVYIIAVSAAAVILVLTVIIAWSTFLKGVPGAGDKFTFENYTDVFLNSMTATAAKNTLFLALGTVIVAVFFALPSTWLLHRTTMPLKKFFLVLMFLHILVPGFIRVIGWIMLLSPNIGIVNQFIRFFIPQESGPLSPYNVLFMAILQGLTLTPSIFFMLAGAFLAVDPSLEECSEICGASKLQSFRRIMLPLVMPALVAGSIYVLLTAASMFEIAALLGAPYQIQVFSTLMYSAMQAEFGLPQYGIAGVYGLLMLIPMLLILRYYQNMLKLSYRYATVTGKGYRPKLTELGRWRWAGVGFVGFYFLIDLFLPLLAVLWSSFLSFIQLPSLAALQTLTLRGYESAFRLLGRGGIVLNTIQLMLLVGIFSVVISLALSWIVVRTRLPGRFALDTASMVPLAVPGVAIGLSVLVVSLLLVKTVPFLYGSVAVIAIAETMRRIPFSSRTMNSSLIQIHPELEEAVQMSGGSRMTGIRAVIIPLITPALFYSFMMAVLHAYREVTLPLFLQGPNNMVISTAIWQLWRVNDTATTSATAVIMIVGMGILVSVLLKAFPELFGETKGHRGRGTSD
jgi:iron(III) transport system permease protein